MTDTVTLEDTFDDWDPEETYTHEIIAGCSILRPRPPATGIPMQAMLEATTLQGKGNEFDSDLARMLGASLVIGTPAKFSDLRKNAAVRRGAALYAATLPEGLSSAARQWAVWGEHGGSSKAMFTALIGISLDDRVTIAHPRDVGDLRRCLLLVEQVPELADRIDMMAQLSPHWDAVVGNWTELQTTLETEAPGWRTSCKSTPSTATMLDRILQSADLESGRGHNP